MGDVPVNQMADPMPIIPLKVEHNTYKSGSQKGKCIGVFTSGGDSQGMNAAVRAVVRLDLLKVVMI